MNRNKLLHGMAWLALTAILVGCGTPLPPGTVSGKVMYEKLTNGGIAEHAPGIMIALCKVPAEGLPEGPAVSRSNRDETEHICTLLGMPTALTDADGAFTLDGVPPATYLVMFHLFPAEVEGIKWNGVALTEAPLNEVDMEFPPSGESDFWENGGPAIAIASWDNVEGMTVTRGNVCSEKYGFCFSIRDKRPHPDIKVEPNETVFIELTAHFKPEE